MTFIFMFLILAAVLLYLLMPLLGKGEAKSARSSMKYEMAELSRRKATLLREIKDIELDFHMGKISEADFKALTDNYRLRAIEVMKKMDRKRGRKPAAPHRVKVTVPEADAGGFCAQCGERLFESAKFCAVCGSEVS